MTPGSDLPTALPTAAGFPSGSDPVRPPPAEPPAPPSIPGYTIEGPIAAGGMGAVWAARHETLQRRVAIKVMRPDLARDPMYVDRFLREARAVARISHPGVVAVHDAGHVDGQLFLAMEYIEGGDLRRRMAAGPLPEAEALRLLIEAADAVAAIHRAGLVHRDLKPENVLLTADGHAKVADLGLARESGGDDRMTTTGEALGTPAYMAPEQANGVADLDARCDVYGLGATLYAALTARPPFSGPTAWATVHQVIAAPPPDPRAVVPAVSARAAQAALTALAKRREDRQPTAEAFAAELRIALDPPAAAAVAAVATARHARALAGGTASAAQQAARGTMSLYRRWRSLPVGWRIGTAYVGGVVLVLVAAVVIGLAAGGESRRERDRRKADEQAGRSEAATEWRRVGEAFTEAGKGIAVVVRPHATDEINGTIPAVERAALDTFSELGFVQRSSTGTDDRKEIDGALPGGDRCHLELTRLEGGKVRIALKIGAVGQRERERLIIEDIRRNTRR